jgi:hypothetical protein
VPSAVVCVASTVSNPVAAIATKAIAAYQLGHMNAATASKGTASATGPPISAITRHTRPSPIQAESGGGDGRNRWPLPSWAATAVPAGPDLAIEDGADRSAPGPRANAHVGQPDAKKVRWSQPPESGIDAAGPDRVNARSIWSCTLLRLRRTVASASSAIAPAAERIIHA